jgi:hypothetical protein
VEEISNSPAGGAPGLKRGNDGSLHPVGERVNLDARGFRRQIPGVISGELVVSPYDTSGPMMRNGDAIGTLYPGE